MSTKYSHKKVTVSFAKQKPSAFAFFAWCRPPPQFTATSHAPRASRSAAWGALRLGRTNQLPPRLSPLNHGRGGTWSEAPATRQA